MNIKNILNIKKYPVYLKIIKKKIWTSNKKISYSQCGEDLIIRYILNSLKINKPIYVDIGAYHPTYLSNTYLFYKNGSRGICIEPDPELFNKIKKKRRKDICLNIGIGMEKEELSNYYVMSTKTLNTFSKEDAEYLEKTTSKKIKEIIKLPIVPINSIFVKHLDNKTPNFISIDTEGYDLKILKSIDFNSFRPEIFCIETITYAEDNTEKKEVEILNFMKEKGYFVYADTYINTIFVDKEIWLNR